MYNYALNYQYLSKIIYKGVFVIRVNSDSPADKADIKLGEIIEEINGNQIKNSLDFFQCMSYK